MMTGISSAQTASFMARAISLKSARFWTGIPDRRASKYSRIMITAADSAAGMNPAANSAPMDTLARAP